MLLLVYPIFEIVFSMFRRKFIHRQSTGQPDRKHLHQMIYLKLTQGRGKISDPAALTRMNKRVAPFGRLMTLGCAVPALVFWRETQWLVAASLLFCVAYVTLYLWL